MQDINYAVRWAKLHAGDLKTRPDLVGLSGQSSGGHLAMLVAMRPHDPRYAAIALPAGSPRLDASVPCVVMSWPVINPLSRYRHAKRALAGANAPEWPKNIIPRHDAYWPSEAEMAEGNPMLALERGEKVQLPPAIWFQARGDLVHDYKDADSEFPGNEPQRFVANYRKAGGEIELRYIEMERHAGHTPDFRKSAAPSPTWSSSSAATSRFNRVLSARLELGEGRQSPPPRHRAHRARMKPTPDWFARHCRRESGKAILIPLPNARPISGEGRVGELFAELVIGPREFTRPDGLQ